MTVEAIARKAGPYLSLIHIFADYWRSKGETRADWQATWRNWIRRRRTFERRPLQNGSKKSIYEQNMEAGERAKKLIFGDAA